MKKLCLCLTVFAALLFFAGCGSSKKDNKNETPDSEETVTDEDAVDAEQSDDTEPDDDSDTEPAEEPDPCDPNPCENIANSDGKCTANETQYTCGCEDGYNWNDLACVRSTPVTLGNICTGQTDCYDMSSSIACPSSPEADFYGQDQHYAALGYCTPQSFTALADVVVDNNTGLIWEKSVSSEKYTWENAQNHCNDLNEEALAGITTWRVPNPLEFLTIVDNSRYRPATNSNFTKTSTDLWTSKLYIEESVEEADSAYFFNPYYGRLAASADLQSELKVLCVSGNEMQASAESDFEISEDGLTATDKRTGLVWEIEIHSYMDWKAMLAYCQSLNSGTETGWRLPNKNEIASLLDPNQKRPWTNFPDASKSDAHCLWSSSTYVANASDAWEICRGDVSTYHKDFEHNYFRCVK